MMGGNESSPPLVCTFPLFCVNYLHKYHSELLPTKTYLKRKNLLILQKEEASCCFRYEEYITNYHSYCNSIPLDFNKHYIARVLQLANITLILKNLEHLKYFREL